MGLGIRTAVTDVSVRIAMSPAVPFMERWRLLRKMGWEHIEPSHIRDGCLFIGRDLHLGYGCYLNRQVFLDASATVTVGKHVQFGPRSMVITGSHRIGEANLRGGTPTAEPVSIGDGCWIGAAAIILPGVHVGDGCVIAAGAVVTRDCEPNGLYAGVPARRVRGLN